MAPVTDVQSLADDCRAAPLNVCVSAALCINERVDELDAGADRTPISLQLLGNTPAASVVGWIADRSSVPIGLQATVGAFFLSGVLFLLVARRQRRALDEPHALAA